MPSPVEIVPGAALQPTHLLSNGRYSVSLRGNGAGWSRFGRADVSRWRDDALRDAYGTFFYLRRNGVGPPVSITEHPAPDDAAAYRATFHADRAFRRGMVRSARIALSGSARGRCRTATHDRVSHRNRSAPI
jgi:cyclic beta-1,2-glucan synthetase